MDLDREDIWKEQDLVFHTHLLKHTTNIQRGDILVKDSWISNASVQRVAIAVDRTCTLPNTVPREFEEGRSNATLTIGMTGRFDSHL